MCADVLASCTCIRVKMSTMMRDHGSHMPSGISGQSRVTFGGRVQRADGITNLKCRWTVHLTLKICVISAESCEGTVHI